ncbi:hypothetical protein BRC90_10520 [Halobacteriales archaeon QS_4_69_34]|nr:MAG: hypothetical protein BRC90_10520 [Halobacteriales archaeon QS_4_69_34]
MSQPSAPNSSGCGATSTGSSRTRATPITASDALGLERRPPLSPVQTSVLLWHRTDRRIEDNRALRRAVDTAEAEGVAVQPVFVLDPAFYDLAIESPAPQRTGGVSENHRSAFRPRSGCSRHG